MAAYQLRIRLLSETTFGRGDGLAGEVDQEIVHDRAGFPYLRGRTLKGLLSEECDGIVAMLPAQHRPTFDDALLRLFGVGGSTSQTQAAWQYGDAQLPELLRSSVARQIAIKELAANDVLDSLTAIRQQTAVDVVSGTPDEGSLRVARVIIRKLVFTSFLTTDDVADNDAANTELRLLAAGCRALRHLGASRTRGRGHVRCTLHDATGKDITATQLDLFASEVRA